MFWGGAVTKIGSFQLPITKGPGEKTENGKGGKAGRL